MARAQIAILALIIVVFFAGLGGFGFQYWKEREAKTELQQKVTELQTKADTTKDGKPEEKPAPVPVETPSGEFEKFRSEEEFREFLTDNAALAGYYGGIGVGAAVRVTETVVPGAPVSGIGDLGTQGTVSAPAGVGPSRISETNVQVVGIDEPDILKTNGKEIYFSPQRNYYGIGILPFERVAADVSVPYQLPKSETMVLKAFPPEQLAKEGSVEKAGDLLLIGGTLAVFNYNEVRGYDVSDPKAPKEKWVVPFDQNNQLVQARLREGTIYLVTRTGINRGRPCPVPLFGSGVSATVAPCTEIYRPGAPAAADVTYHIATVNPATGEAKRGISFVGSYDSVVYMSRDAVYVAYAYEGDAVALMFGFFKEHGDLIPASVTDRIEKLAGYDIGRSAKMVELQETLSEFFQGLSSDDQLRVQNELQNRAEDYFGARKRELQKTDIVKISASDFVKQATGTTPGRLLNQFSLDEYQGNLRVATTVGQGSGWYFGVGVSQDTESDVYVLDGSLAITGSVKGLGLTERIYSARFVENKGYLVTFRQTDPFYVIDLANPRNPVMAGELKIPGFSSYLHPISKDRILGVGREGSQVKISLFNVASAANPKEAAKYTLSEFWSEVANTHHAFLLDDKHKIFFLPGSKGGYVFSYANDELKLQKAVSGISARRALFLDDYLYIAGDQKIVVLDEKTWETVKELVF